MRVWLGLVAVVFAVPLLAQKPKAAVRVRVVDFVDAKPLLGLPSGVSQALGLCSRDGLSFFAGAADGASPGELYSVSTTGEVRRILRKLPVDFTDVSLKDFFPSDHTLVTLVEASNRDGRDGPDARPRGTEYFLTLSDPGGGQSDLLTLGLHFKPLKVGAYGSGDVLVLGWDTANELPMLARLKDDGTVRKFIDYAEMRKTGGAAALSELSKAALVPFGDDILLTFPGTTQPVWIMRDRGEDRARPLPIPAGYVLRDVLGSDGRAAFVFRVQLAGESATPGADEAKTPKVPVAPRLLEDNYLLTEYKLGDVPTTAVTCAARQSLIAVWTPAIASPAGEKEGAGSEVAQRLVVGSVRR